MTRIIGADLVQQIADKELNINEAVPVKPGTWEEMRNAYGELEGWIHAECGREVKRMENFCPHCGADMRGDSK